MSRPEQNTNNQNISFKYHIISNSDTNSSDISNSSNFNKKEFQYSFSKKPNPGQDPMHSNLTDSAILSSQLSSSVSSDNEEFEINFDSTPIQKKNVSEKISFQPQTPVKMPPEFLRDDKLKKFIHTQASRSIHAISSQIKGSKELADEAYFSFFQEYSRWDKQKAKEKKNQTSPNLSIANAREHEAQAKIAQNQEIIELNKWKSADTTVELQKPQNIVYNPEIPEASFPPIQGIISLLDKVSLRAQAKKAEMEETKFQADELTKKLSDIASTA